MTYVNQEPPSQYPSANPFTCCTSSVPSNTYQLLTYHVLNYSSSSNWENIFAGVITLISTFYVSKTLVVFFRKSFNSASVNPDTQFHSYFISLMFTILKTGSEGGIFTMVGQGTPKFVWRRQWISVQHTFNATAPLETPLYPTSIRWLIGSRYAEQTSCPPSAPFHNYWIH